VVYLIKPINEKNSEEIFVLKKTSNAKIKKKIYNSSMAYSSAVTERNMKNSSLISTPQIRSMNSKERKKPTEKSASNKNFKHKYSDNNIIEMRKNPSPKEAIVTIPTEPDNPKDKNPPFKRKKSNTNKETSNKVLSNINFDGFKIDLSSKNITKSDKDTIITSSKFKKPISISKFPK
jgi:hypothetical protein